METNIVNHFGSVKVGEMQLTQSVKVGTGTSVRSVVEAMAGASESSAVIMSGSDIVGIFTERDVTRRVAAAPDRWDAAIEQFMTPDPIVISDDQSAVEALRLSNTHAIRNIPVLDSAGGYLGTVTLYDLIRLASTYLRSHTDLGHEMSAELSLHYVDLSGIESHPALQVSASHSVGHAIAMMIEANTGLVSVVNDRGVVIGEFTEHDVFTKLACQVRDLDDHLVGDWLTEDIAGALPASSVADGLHLMADVGHRYLILLNETNHALGVLTFRDIADYFETALEVV